MPHAIASCDGGSLVYVVKELLDRINRISAVNFKDFVHSVSIIRFCGGSRPLPSRSPRHAVILMEAARRRLVGCKSLNNQPSTLNSCIPACTPLTAHRSEKERGSPGAFSVSTY